MLTIIAEKLIALADLLDKSGLISEADTIDSLVKTADVMMSVIVDDLKKASQHIYQLPKIVQDLGYGYVRHAAALEHISEMSTFVDDTKSLARNIMGDLRVLPADITDLADKFTKLQEQKKVTK